jgi:hypothetical protein
MLCKDSASVHSITKNKGNYMFYMNYLSDGVARISNRTASGRMEFGRLA